MIRPSLDYTDRDFDALLARARQLITAAFPEWEDDAIADFGNILVEFFCFVGDVDAFYQNQQARETRWSQARLRKNLLSHMKLINYVATGATAAHVEQTFTLGAALPGNLIVPKGSRVTTLEVTAPIRYQLLEDLVIPAGHLEAVGIVEHSEFETDVFNSNGAANQAATLSSTPFLPASLIVTSANGTYSQVANFLNSSATDRHYVVVIDENDRAQLRFGNGISGAIPVSFINASYKTGGGASGRVEAGALQRLESAGFSDVLGNIAELTTTNLLKSEGGYDRQPNASIKLLAPLSLQVLERTVSRPDYETVAKSRPDLVSRALMLTNTEDPAVPVNQGYLFLVPPGAGDVPDSTIAAVRELFVRYPYGPSFTLNILASTYLVVDIFVRLHLAKGAVASEVKTAVLAALDVFFEDRVSDEASENFGADNTAIDFGWKMQDADGNPDTALAFTDVQNVVRDAAGVRKIDPSNVGFLLNGKRDDLQIGLRQFPKLGTVTIVNAETGATL